MANQAVGDLEEQQGDKLDTKSGLPQRGNRCFILAIVAALALMAAGTCGASVAAAVLAQACKENKDNLVTEEEVIAAQNSWGSAVLRISNTHQTGGDFVGAASAAAAELYDYGNSIVLFKPTLASEQQFRPSATSALSYFVGGSAIPGGIAEDTGFAINGGRRWKAVRFENHQIKLDGDVATAMGNYFFTSAADDSISKVEYTFGYKKSEQGHLKIFLHHSSLPFTAPITEAEVLAAQESWKNAVLRISNTFKANGDYVAEATQAAAQLYGYGHFDVLFKPTRASAMQFRPTATGALSYFVGNAAMTNGNGIAEDTGFAINSGIGWKAIRFENHKIVINGDTATAMGNYYFTRADNDQVSKVEYTFGYKKDETGHLRIFLHHSSSPFTSP